MPIDVTRYRGETHPAAGPCNPFRSWTRPTKKPRLLAWACQHIGVREAAIRARGSPSP